MSVHHRSPTRPRPAFTLVELIVAVAIIAVLAALAVLIIPQLQDNQRGASGADQVQGALFLAKQWAMRDQVPRGIRLVPTLDPDGKTRVHSLQLIEQPDYFVPPTTTVTIGNSPVIVQPALLGVLGPVTAGQPGTFLFGAVLTPQAGGNPAIAIDTPALTFIDFFGGNPGFPPGNVQQRPYWPVQPLDYVDLLGNNKVDGLYAIASVNPSQNPTTATVSDNLTVVNVPQETVNLLQANPAQYPGGTAGILAVYPNFVPFQNPIAFRVARGPRPMVGQQPINLPADIVVDYPSIANNFPHAPGAPFAAGGTLPLAVDSQTQQFDILFAPSGKVLRDLGRQGKVVLWIYDNSDPTGGAMSLVAVYTRTGIIAAHPVNLTAVNPATNTIDPYFYITDGRASGM